MNRICSLHPLHIPWKGNIRDWNTISRTLLPVCDAKGEVRDASGEILFQLIPKQTLGAGTFGMIDAFEKQAGEERQLVAMKRNNHPAVDLFLEALFQWKLHEELAVFGIQTSVPKVYDIFTYKGTGDVWFTMEAFEPNLLSQWCVRQLSQSTFPLLLLQIALVLEVFENALKIDHRDLKVNNILVIDEPVTMEVTWKGKPQTLCFPFRIVFVDFGFACIQRLLDLREGSKGVLPPLDPCPKVGRDMFQVLVSLWSLVPVRRCLETMWGGWVRERIQNASASVKVNCLTLAETSTTLDWMYSTTDCENFSAPLCAPNRIIEEFLDKN